MAWATSSITGDVMWTFLLVQLGPAPQNQPVLLQPVLYPSVENTTQQWLCSRPRFSAQ